MTEKEIDAMEAGRELDALIAERVMGWQITKRKPHLMHIAPWIGGGDIMAEDYTPAFSGHIADAWLVVEKLRELGFWCRMDTPWINDGSPADKFWAGFTPHQTTGWNGRPDYWEEGDTLPLAICRAALKAVTNCHKITTDEADDLTQETVQRQMREAVSLWRKL